MKDNAKKNCNKCQDSGIIDGTTNLDYQFCTCEVGKGAEKHECEMNDMWSEHGQP